MDEKVRQQLVDDHFLFVSGDKNLQVSSAIKYCIRASVIWLHWSYLVEFVIKILPGKWDGEGLAGGKRHFPQQGQNLPDLGETKF